MIVLQNETTSALLSGIRFERALGVSTLIGAMPKLILREMAILLSPDSRSARGAPKPLTVPRKQGAGHLMGCWKEGE
jgi:hypothetical protein